MTDGKTLAGRMAWVTGSSRGIGRVVAEHLASLGACVAIHGTTPASPRQLGEGGSLADEADKIARAHGVEVLPVHGDLTDPGAVATDEEQGDLTASIRKGGFVNTAVPGSYVLTYTVTNNLNNSASVSRIVTIEDTVAPILTLRPPTAMTVSLNERFIDPGASADDNCDGNVPVTVVGAVNTAKAGVYLLTYIATDSTGNDAFPLTRRVTVLGTMGGEGELREGEGGEGAVGCGERPAGPAAKAADSDRRASSRSELDLSLFLASLPSGEPRFSPGASSRPPGSSNPPINPPCAWSGASRGSPIPPG